jgi:hypothetical protein
MKTTTLCRRGVRAKRTAVNKFVQVLVNVDKPMRDYFAAQAGNKSIISLKINTNDHQVRHKQTQQQLHSSKP